MQIFIDSNGTPPVSSTIYYIGGDMNVFCRGNFNGCTVQLQLSAEYNGVFITPLDCIFTDSGETVIPFLRGVWVRGVIISGTPATDINLDIC